MKRNLFLFQTGICRIEGACYEADDVNPIDDKLVCKPDVSTTSWTLSACEYYASIIILQTYMFLCFHGNIVRPFPIH